MSHLATRPELLARVHRIAGQVAAVEKALAANEPCATVLHRVAAVRGAVNGLLDEVIAEHLTEHVALPGLSDAERAAGADELLAVIRRYAK
jgi:DNA-binding FrmR family transcriptional regulator